MHCIKLKFAQMDSYLVMGINVKKKINMAVKYKLRLQWLMLHVTFVQNVNLVQQKLWPVSQSTPTDDNLQFMYLALAHKWFTSVWCIEM